MYKKLLSLIVVLLLAGSVSAALVAQYEFEQNADDSTANAYDGTVTGTATYVAGPVDGNAISLDGSTWIDVPAGTVTGLTDQITIMFWAKIPVAGLPYVPPNGPPAFGYTAFVFNSATQDHLGWVFPWFNDNSYWMTYVANTSSDFVTMINAYAQVNNGGNWAHWTCVANKTTGYMAIYKDGNVVVTQGGLLKKTAMQLANVTAGRIGAQKDGTAGVVGAIDDFRIYDKALSVASVGRIVDGADFSLAYDPSPADMSGDVPNDVVLSWLPGDYADVAGHNVYFGPNEADVTAGINGTDMGTSGVTGPDGIGRFSYDPCTGALPYSTTYYWRVDEINDLGSPDPCTGPVWSFTTLVDPDALIPGLLVHYQFEGNTNDSGANGLNGTLTGTATYVAGPTGGQALSFNGTTRVNIPALVANTCGDEITVAFWALVPVQYGPADYRMAFYADGGATGALSINFNWPGANGMMYWFQDAVTGDYAQMGEAPTATYNSGKWAYWTYTKNAVKGTMKIYKDGILLSTGGGATSLAGIDFTSVTIGADSAGASGYVGVLDDFRVYDYALSEAEIGRLVLVKKASGPKPADGGILDLVYTDGTISWFKGLVAAAVDGHQVYFGTDEDDVLNGSGDTKMDLGDVVGPDAGLRYSYDPGTLELDTTYYWRVDAVNNPSAPDPCVGDVWEFTTSTCFMLDGMESYWGDRNWGDPTAIRSHYRDGFTDTPESSGSNIYNFLTTQSTNPSITALFDAAFPDWNDMVGAQNNWMFYSYNNTGNIVDFRNYDANGIPYPKQTYTAPYFSEIRIDPVGPNSLGLGSDWTSVQDMSMEIHFHGDPCNSPETMYVALQSTNGNVGIVKYEDFAGNSPNDLQLDTWVAWLIDMGDFNRPQVVDMANIKKFYIGFGDRTSPTQGGKGVVVFDNIHFCLPRCLVAYGPHSDISGNCSVGGEDIALLQADWLLHDSTITPVAPSEANLRVRYEFESDLTDGSGNGFDASLLGGTEAYVTGPNSSNAFDFNGLGNGLDVPNDVFLTCVSEVTIAFWQNGATLDPGNTVFYGKDDNGQGSMNCHFPYGGALYLDLGARLRDGTPGGFAEECRIAAGLPTADYQGEWSHWAFMKNSNDETMKVYRNGLLWLEGEGKSPLVDGQLLAQFRLADWNWNGDMDDFRVYDKALTNGEVMYLAGFTEPMYTPVPRQNRDLYLDGEINLKDFTTLADEWLVERLWPSEGWRSIAPKE